MSADYRHSCQDSESLCGELLHSIEDREWETFHQQIKDVPHSFVLEGQAKLTHNVLRRLKNVLESDIQVGFKTAVETARAHNLMAYILFSLCDSPAALDEIDAALKAEGDSPNLVSLANMAVILWRLGRHPDAQTHVDKLLDMRRKAEDFNYQYLEVKAKAELAFSYTRFGPSFTHIAVKVFTEVIAKAREPEVWLWKFGLGMTKRRFLHVQFAPMLCEGEDAGQLEVVETLRLFLEVTQNCPCPNLKAKAYVEVALLMKMRWSPEILTILDQLAEITPLEACQRALALDENDCSVLWKSGKIYRYERELDEACRLLEKAVSLRPTSTELHHLGLVYKAMATRAKNSGEAFRWSDIGRGNRRGSRDRRGSAGGTNPGHWGKGGNSGPERVMGFESRGRGRMKAHGHRGRGGRGNYGYAFQSSGYGRNVERVNIEQIRSPEQVNSGHTSALGHERRGGVDSSLAETCRKKSGNFAPMNLACQPPPVVHPGHAETDRTWRECDARQQHVFCRETESTTGSVGESDEISDTLGPQLSQLSLVITQRDIQCKEAKPVSLSESSSSARGTGCHEPLQPPHDETQQTTLKSVVNDDTDYSQPEHVSRSSSGSSIGSNSNPNQQLPQAASHQIDVRLLKGVVKSPTKESTQFSWGNQYVEKSMECLKKAVEMSSEGDNTRAVYDLALMHRALGELPEALVLLEKIIQGSRQVCMGPFDKVTAFEQAGLILIEMSDNETDDSKKQSLYDRGQSMLNMALLTASRLYPKMPRLPSMVKDVFQSFSTLLKAADASTRNPHEKVREKARLFQLIKEHKHSIQLLQIVEAMAPGERGNPDHLRMFIQNYVGSEQYEEALTFIEILQQTSESGNIMGYFHDKNYVQKVYMLAARQDLLKTPNVSGRHRFYFCSAFTDIMGAVTQSDTSSEDSATSEDECGDGAEETCDVMIIHERTASEPADVLTSVLQDVCGLKVSSMYKHVLLGKLEVDRVVHNMSRSRLVVVLAGARKISGELRLYIQTAAMRPTTVTLLTEGDHIPKLLSTHRSRGCTLQELLDIQVLSSGRRSPTDHSDACARLGIGDCVSSVCDFFSFLVNLRNWSVILE